MNSSADRLFVLRVVLYQITTKRIFMSPFGFEFDSNNSWNCCFEIRLQRFLSPIIDMCIHLVVEAIHYKTHHLGVVTALYFPAIKFKKSLSEENSEYYTYISLSNPRWSAVALSNPIIPSFLVPLLLRTKIILIGRSTASCSNRFHIQFLLGYFITLLLYWGSR